MTYSNPIIHGLQSNPPPPGDGAPKLTIRQALAFAYRDRKRILIAFAIPMVLATIVAFVLTPKYKAVTSLLVRPGQEYMYRSEVGDGYASPVVLDAKNTVASEVDILTSRPVEEKVIANIGVARLYPHLVPKKPGAIQRFLRAVGISSGSKLSPEDRALLSFQKQLDAALVKDSTVIEVTFQHPDRQLAAQVLNNLVDVYMERRRVIMARMRTEFERAQTAKIRKELTDLELRIEKYKAENGIISFDQQRALLLAQQNTLDARLKEASVSEASSNGRLGTLKSNLNRLPEKEALYTETTQEDPGYAAMQTLLQLKLRRQEALSKYAESSPVVADLNQQIAQVESTIRELEAKRSNIVHSGRSPVRDVMETQAAQHGAEASGAHAGRHLLADQYSEVSKQLNELSAREFEFQSMLRDRRVLEASYESIMKKLQDAQFSDALDLQGKANVSVIEPALPPIEKRNLTPLVLIVGFVLSMASALVAAFISELMRDTYLSPDELARSLPVPVLACFPIAEDGVITRTPYRNRLRA